jgi:hypothetical protein
MMKRKPKPRLQHKRLRQKSAYELFRKAGLMGCAKGLPKDLSTNKKHFAGFAESKAD